MADDQSGDTPSSDVETIIERTPAESPSPEIDPSPLVFLGELGRGGMGSVHHVLEPSLRRHMALKRLERVQGAEREQTRRFIVEAQITAQLDHPAIAPIHELSTDETGHFFTMKLVKGETLTALIQRLGPARLHPDALRRMLGIFLRVCEAVAFAHDRGVIHCDIKPDNVMVGRFGQVYLMDWGLACLSPGAGAVGDRVDLGENAPSASQPAAGSGTPGYMSPEQFGATTEQIDHRTDIFALGATLYHILAGHAPLADRGYPALLAHMLDPSAQTPPPHEAVQVGNVPRGLSEIAMKAMQRSPHERHESVDLLQQDVEAFLDGTWHLPRRRHPAGSVIVRQGDPGDEAFVIESGRCIVYSDSGGDRAQLRELGPGDLFGETAIFSGSARSATVEAADDSTLIVVTEHDLFSGLGLASWLGGFVKTLAERFREADQRLRQR